MGHDVFTKTLWDGRRGLLGWSVAIGLLSLMYGSFYPSVNSPQMAAVLEAYPKALREAFGFTDTSPAGYLSSSVFGVVIPLLVAVFAIAAGTRAIAGDEEARLLDLLLAHPVGRTEVLLHRYAAAVVGVAALGAAVAAGLLVIWQPAELSEIPLAHLVAAVVQLVAFGAFFAALAIAVGAATGRRAVVFAVSGTIVVIGYVGNAIAPQVAGLTWLQWLSPFHYYLGGTPLRDGLDITGLLVLITASALLIGLATATFDRRDVAV